MATFLLNFVFGIFNIFTPKIKHSIYINGHPNRKYNCIDIINNSSDNSLHFIREFVKCRFKEKVTVVFEYFEDNRLPLYEKLAEDCKQNNISLRLLRSYNDKSGAQKIKLFIKKYVLLQRCRIWAVNTGDVKFYGKLACQKIFNLNYFTSCKNDFIPGRNYRWSHLDYMITTSFSQAMIACAQIGVKYDAIATLGFPRNDTLFDDSKKQAILDWISSETGFVPQKIIVYAPTARDWENTSKEEIHRDLFGYKIDDLEKFLKKNKVCIIAKRHNYMSRSGLEYPEGVIDFKYCYDFSFYDLMAISDCLITDYSSVGYDFLLLDRPLIYNLYDLEMYEKDRGLSYEPYEDFCPGVIVKNSSEMANALSDAVNGIDTEAEKRRRLTRYFHKYCDNKSTDRCIDYFCKTFGFEICGK